MGSLSTPRRTDLFQPFEDVFNDFFNGFFSEVQPQNLKMKSGYPKVNAYRYEGKFYVSAAVPGMESEDLDIQLSKSSTSAVSDMRLLTISGKKIETDEGVNYGHREIRQSSFERSLVLPEDVDVTQDPNATLENGILTLTWDLDYTPSEPEVKKISISEKTEEVEEIDI